MHIYYIVFCIYCRCLHKTGGILQLKLETACKVVLACAVLHNMAVDINPEDAEAVEEAEEEELEIVPENDQSGMRARASLVTQFFARRWLKNKMMTKK